MRRVMAETSFVYRVLVPMLYITHWEQQIFQCSDSGLQKIDNLLSKRRGTTTATTTTVFVNIVFEKMLKFIGFYSVFFDLAEITFLKSVKNHVVLQAFCEIDENQYFKKPYKT